MNNLKATYVKRVIEMFVSGRYSRSTEARVARWITNGNDSEAKDDALETLWDATLSNATDEDAVNHAYSQWAGRNDAGAAGASRPHDRRAFYLRLWQGVAACLLVAVGAVGAILLRQRQQPVTMAQVYCGAGDTRTISLPDGTEVMLNGATSIVYPEQFTGDCREVILLGEANFKVAKDASRPFVVKSSDVNVTALGTEFNLKAYPAHNEVRSTLLEGKVKVSYGENNDGFILQPSEQLVYNRNTGTASVAHPVVDDVTAWQRGELVFSNATLAEIIRELEVRFSHDFVYNTASLPSDRYTFRFRRGMKLAEVMEIVSDVAGNITVTLDDDCCKIKRAL